jgi:hypothetical protein
MAIKLDEFRKQIAPEVQKAAKAKAVDIITEISLNELRKLRGRNQISVAEQLKMAQSNISQLEARNDALVSTLSEYIRALGGELELHASFPDGQRVKICL